MIRAILTDIEGTTSSIDFVHEVLFPYSAQALPQFLREHAHSATVAPWIAQVAAEIGAPISALDAVTDALLEWLRQDRKHTALKALQGMIWQRGYAEQIFQAHVYSDVAPALRAWHAADIKLYVYSSGSIAAQKLFFSHSEAGDLSALFSGYFDTTSGPKRDPDSYRSILSALALRADQVLFLSDITAELDAARSCGMPTRWLVRKPASTPASDAYPAVSGFDQITFPPDAAVR